VTDKELIDQDLLEILACPETHQPLAMASAEQVDALNKRIQAGGVKNVGGADVSETIDAGLVREDGKIVYPIRNQIPVLLVDEGLALE